MMLRARRAGAWLAVGVFICASLITADAKAAAKDSEKTRVTIQHGTVVGMRWISPDASALGASADVMGRVSCGAARIKRTPIFRVETTSQYFDLSKLCGSGDAEYWRDYEHLPIGERVTFRVTRETEPRTTDQASRCHFLDERDVQQCMELSLLGPAKLYRARCTCRETHAYVEQGKTGIWEFRVVGSGAVSKAKTAEGSSAWIRFQRGVVTAIGWTKDPRSLVGSELSTDRQGRVSCDGSPVERVPIYRIIAGSQYLDLEDGCDEADVMDLGTDETWGEDARLKIGQKITFHVENNPGWKASKQNTAQRLAWVDHGDHVWEFSIAKIGLKSALPVGPSFGEVGSGAGPSNKCGGVVNYPVAVYQPNPPIPKRAKNLGTVVVFVSLLVDPQGNVSQESIVNAVGGLGTSLDQNAPGIRGLLQNALSAVRTWKFRPGTCGGVPTPMRVVTKISFTVIGSPSS